MKRPWQIWLAFAACTILVLVTMGWFSRAAIRGDLMRQRAEFNMQREQQISLALWRMDTKLAPLVAEEAARPHYVYDSFLAVDGADGSGNQATRWAPSPLLIQNEGVQLNFGNYISTGEWTSPQVPGETFEELAAENNLSADRVTFNRQRLDKLAAKIDAKQLLAKLPEVETTPLVVSAAPNAPITTQAIEPLANSEADLFGAVNAPAAEPNAELPPNQPDQQLAMQQQIALPQAKFTKGKQNDYSDRGSRFQGAVQKEFAKQRSGNLSGGYGGYRGGYGGERGGYGLQSTQAKPQTVVEGLSKPLWINGELLLARRIVRDNEVGVLGSWLDWPKLQQELLSEVADLFPGAELRPLLDVEAGDPSRMLAGLPVELFVPTGKQIFLPSETLRWTLGFGWLGLIVALGAVAALLWGVVALSERRAAFVSSVTHELRTPLTTFRMYADMLARDMVPEAERRQQYLTTLQREAERLTHLVENVLSYARLERGRKPNASERVTVGQLLDRQQTRLAERAEQSEMAFEVECEQNIREATLLTDVAVVEQILFNLVDNAAKYAATAEDRRIVCEVRRADAMIAITIRDFGPGFDRTNVSRNPRPFSKSAEQAATSAPGVGLGLALCRRLAQQLGGRLQIHTDGQGGAVTLFLASS